MLSRSTPDLTCQVALVPPKNYTTFLPKLSCSNTNLNKHHVSGKGDAGLIGPSKIEIPRTTFQSLSVARKQTSAPAINIAEKPRKTTKLNRSDLKATASSPSTPRAIKKPLVLSISEPEAVCEALVKDPKLKVLCSSIGIGYSPNTIVGPIEKGQLVIGTLQEGLADLIKLKTKIAEKKGKKFHIQQSGLDAAVRALENAERSLKTIKEVKEPILGKARRQQSVDSLPTSLKATEAVIRILNNTRDKFERMDNCGVNNFMKNVFFFSSLPNSATSSRRSTGSSVVTPLTPLNTISSSRSRTPVSTPSTAGSRVGTGKMIAIM